jgi:hypothetical protein
MTDVKKELNNLQNIVNKAAFESLEMVKKHNRGKHLRMWDDQ